MDEVRNNAWTTNFDKAVSFTTDATASSQVIRSFLTYAWSNYSLLTSNNVDHGSYTIGIWSNSGSNTPGSLLAGTTFTFFDYNSTTKLARYSNSGFTLADNTTYWLVADETSALGFAVDTTASPNQIGWALGNNVFYRSASSTDAWSPVGGPMKIELSTNAVPEPSALSLLVVGLGGVIALRRCRRSAV